MNGPKENKRRRAIRKAMPQIIARIPRRFGMTREQWGAEIDRELIKVWKELSAVNPSRADALYRASTRKRPTAISPVPSKAELAALDEIIITQAVTLGWRILASPLVLFRFSRWGELPFHPELFERMGKALARSVRILAGDELPPIDDPGLREHKKLAVPELRLLLREMRKVYSRRSPAPDARELADWFLKSLVGSERSPLLARNLLHWGVFLKAQENEGVLKLQLTRRLQPAALFDSWLARFKGHNLEYLRKRLTRFLRRSSYPQAGLISSSPKRPSRSPPVL